MSKTVLKTLAVLFVASVLCVGNAFALNPIARNDSGRVTVGQNGYGDVLLGQIYQSLSNYETTIKVINSSRNFAVVARVVFRSALYSCDVFDFNIYLTPTDAWDGVVRLNAAGNVEIYSDDDSVMSDEHFAWDGVAACNPFDGTWGNEVPLQREFYTDCLTGGDINEMGHFEVIGLHAFPATAPLSKDTLAMASHWTNPISGLDARVNINNLINCDFNLLGAAVDVPNILTGTVTLENSAYSQKASMNLVALQNWERIAIAGFETSRTIDLNTSSFNSIPEIEAALAKTSYSFPFDFSATGDNDVIIINTLPTRYEWALSGMGPTFAGGICGVTYTAYDMEETVIIDFLSGDTALECLPEVSMQFVRPLIASALSEGYMKGWINVGTFTVGSGLSATGPSGLGPLNFVQFVESGASYSVGGNLTNYTYLVNYTGVPMINSTITLDQSNDMMWKYAASPESTVTYIEDIDGDGNIDVFEDTIVRNGVLDAGEDRDGDNRLDLYNEDANATGVLGTITVRQ